MPATQGWKTSEFWVTVAGSVVTLLNQAFGLGLDSATITAFVGMVASYVLGRSAYKAGLKVEGR